jgi:hypothetical protein
MKRLESNALERISVTRAFLSQAAQLSKNNPKLAQILSDDLERYSPMVDQLFNDLENHPRGLVQKKAQKALDLLSRIEISSNHWTDRLGEEARNNKAILTEKINGLIAIAKLDDPSILNAQSYLLTPDYSNSLNRSEKKSSIPISDLVHILKKENSDWLQSQAYLQEIHDIDRSVHDAYLKVEQERQNVTSLVAQWSKLISGTNNWPPNSVSIDLENQEITELEKIRESILNENCRAIWLVNRLGDLLSRYQKVESKIIRIQQQAENESRHILDIDHQIETAIGLWQYQKNVYVNDTVAISSIQKLISEVDRKIEALKKQSRQRTSNYQQIEEELTNQFKSLKEAVIPIKDDQEIDINGEIRIGRK